MARLTLLLAGAALACAAPCAADPVDRWAESIREASARFLIPEQWIREVMRVESGGHSTVGGKPIVSPDGAAGLMQLMPGTWRDMRALLGLGHDPSDPHDNILAGAAYLRAMYDRFGYPGLFAAYNAGPGRYAVHLATGRRLPPETRAYVAKIAAAAALPQPTERARSAALFVVQQRHALPESPRAPPAALFAIIAPGARPGGVEQRRGGGEQGAPSGD